MAWSRPVDRYSDGRESARILAALGKDALTIAALALRLGKDELTTRSLIGDMVRRQGTVLVDHREWHRRPYRDGYRLRCVAYYRRAHANKHATSTPPSVIVWHGTA